MVEQKHTYASLSFYLLTALYFMFLIGIIVCTPAEAQRVWYKDCVNASVGWGSPGAVDNYGRFTIPQMSTATQLTFKNEDPGGTYTKTTIDYAIYSVAQKGRLFNPVTLPAGEYQLSASGKPGATATLCYTLVRGGRAFTSQPSTPTGSYKWVYLGIGDCTGNDVGATQNSSAPDNAKCNASFVGKTAVCWDGSSQKHYGSKNVWCTYKNINADVCTGGGSPGHKYVCVAKGRSYTSVPPASQQCPPGPYNIKVNLIKKDFTVVQDESGLFNVPQGCQGMITYFFWQDGTPGTGRTTQIGPYNIFSHTQNRYVATPISPLPPGQYRFMIGGHPNATGTIQYTLAPAGALPAGQIQPGQPAGQQPVIPQAPAKVDEALDIFKKAKDLFSK